MAAEVECVVKQSFSIVNRITWRKPPFSTKAEMFRKPDLHSYFPVSEAIIFAEHYGADNMAKGEAGYAAKCDELRGFLFEPLRAYLESEVVRSGLSKRWLKERWMQETNTKSEMPRHWLEQKQFELPTPRNYEWLRGHCNSNGGGYLAREYEDLRREYEDLRRPFSVTADVPYTDVWDFPTVKPYSGKHICEKPLAMLEHIVTASSREGDTVLDCFCGSGATGEAAVKYGREFIGIELSEHWCQQSEERLREAENPTQLRLAEVAGNGATAQPTLTGAEQ